MPMRETLLHHFRKMTLQYMEGYVGGCTLLSLTVCILADSSSCSFGNCLMPFTAVMSLALGRCLCILLSDMRCYWVLLASGGLTWSTSAVT